MSQNNIDYEQIPKHYKKGTGKRAKRHEKRIERQNIKRLLKLCAIINDEEFEDTNRLMRATYENTFRSNDRQCSEDV